MDIFYRDDQNSICREDCMEFITIPQEIENNTILIGGVTKNNIPYALFVNGVLVDDKGYGKDTEKEGKRISLSEPEYLQYNNLFTKKEKSIFSTTMKKYWKDVQETYNLIYKSDPEINIKDIYIPQECPDYNKLESED